jgi:nucleotide-binding universal stress UspA family protein
MHPSGNLFIAAIDFWNPSLNALEMAARFANQFEGRVLAVHVIEKSFHYPEDIPIDSDTIEEDLTAALKKLLKPLSKRGIPVEFELRRGDMPRQLVQAMHDHEADAVFIGIREGRMLEDIFIGANTFTLLKSGEIPVVVVDSLPSEPEIKEILIPLDRSVGVDGVLKFIAGLEHPIATSALLITGMSPEESEEAVTVAANAVADKLETLGFLHIEVEIVKHEDPYSAVMDQLRAQVGNFDLVLLEQHDLASKGQFTLGSFVEEVVTKGRMPVVCLPIQR